MPIDVMCPECDSVDVLRVDRDFVKDGKVHEHWECEECRHEWVEKIPVDDYDECPNSEREQLPCNGCAYIHDSGLWRDCSELEESK